MKNSDETSLSVLSIKLLLIYIIDFGQSYEWLAVLVDQIDQSSKMELQKRIWKWYKDEYKPWNGINSKTRRV